MLSRSWLTAVLFVALPGLSACGGIGNLLPEISSGASGAGDSSSAVWRDDVNLQLEGVLAVPESPGSPAAMCPALILDDGRIYALIGDLRDFTVGDRVEVIGPPAAWSTCQTYRVLRADEIRLIEPWTGGSSGG